MSVLIGPWMNSKTFRETLEEIRDKNRKLMDEFLKENLPFRRKYKPLIQCIGTADMTRAISNLDKHVQAISDLTDFPHLVQRMHVRGPNTQQRLDGRLGPKDRGILTIKPSHGLKEEILVRIRPYCEEHKLWLKPNKAGLSVWVIIPTKEGVDLRPRKQTPYQKDMVKKIKSFLVVNTAPHTNKEKKEKKVYAIHRCEFSDDKGSSIYLVKILSQTFMKAKRQYNVAAGALHDLLEEQGLPATDKSIKCTYGDVAGRPYSNWQRGVEIQIPPTENYQWPNGS